MHLRGQTTTFQTRLEISEHAAAGLNDTRITERVGCSIWTVRKWRRRSMHQGRVGFKSPMGRPAAGPRCLGGLGQGERLQTLPLTSSMLA